MTHPVTWPSAGLTDVGTMEVVFSFEANTTVNPLTSSYRGGCIQSIVCNAAGDWSVTLTCANVMRQVLWADVRVEGLSDGSTPYTSDVYWDETVAAGTTVRVFTSAKSAPTVLASPAAGRKICVRLLVKTRAVDYNY